VELWHRISGDATRLAYLLDTDADAARATARRVFSRCLARLQDRRSAYLIDVGFRRDVVRLVVRRRRWRVLHGVLGRTAMGLESPGIQLGHKRSALWRAFAGLKTKQRAALALESYVGLARGEAADVLGCSYGGATALVDRAWDALAGHLGEVPDAGELESLLRDVATEVELPDVEPGAVRRRARRARTASAVVALCVIGALAGVTAALATSAAEEDPDDDRTTDRGGTQVRILTEPEDGLSFVGAPAWCPDPRGTRSVDRSDERDVALVAERVAMSLVNDYADRLAHLIEVPDGAPPLARWPVNPSPAGLRVVGSGPGIANDTLGDLCGPAVAARSWIIILQDPFPPRGDAVAFYVLRRADGFKVWGTFGGTAN
jgi:hypothetical protein